MSCLVFPMPTTSFLHARFWGSKTHKVRNYQITHALFYRYVRFPTCDHNATITTKEVTIVVFFVFKKCICIFWADAFVQHHFVSDMTQHTQRNHSLRLDPRCRGRVQLVAHVIQHSATTLSRSVITIPNIPRTTIRNQCEHKACCLVF